jgi:hypothetical protein
VPAALRAHLRALGASVVIAHHPDANTSLDSRYLWRVAYRLPGNPAIHRMEWPGA